MNKKLKNQIFQEIEKEDNYRDRSHELKSHILFAEKVITPIIKNKIIFLILLK